MIYIKKYKIFEYADPMDSNKRDEIKQNLEDIVLELKDNNFKCFITLSSFSSHITIQINRKEFYDVYEFNQIKNTLNDINSYLRYNGYYFNELRYGVKTKTGSVYYETLKNIPENNFNMFKTELTYSIIPN